MELPATHGSCPALLVSENDGVVAATIANATKKRHNANSNTVTSLVEVRPLVLLSVLDHHTRRPEGAGRVIGTLLGTRTGNRVEITNCFAVPHAERGDEVAIGKDFNRQMSALHARANRRERVVGWYATALPPEEEDGGLRFVADTSSLVHEFYAAECEHDDPVHVVLDAGLDRDEVGLRAYRCAPARVGGEPLANLFHEVRLSLVADEGERVCLDGMVRRQFESDESKSSGGVGDEDEAEGLRRSVARLSEVLGTVRDYVDDVVEGRTVPDDAVGLRIADALSAVPRVRPDALDRDFHGGLQDLLMVTYLSNLTKTQLTIAEKLNAALHL